MAQFVDFKLSDCGTPVTVNPGHVAKVRPCPDDPDKVAFIRLEARSPLE